MRGGEGLSFVAQSAYYTRGNRVFVPYFADKPLAILRLDGGELTVEQKSDYRTAELHDQGGRMPESAALSGGCSRLFLFDLESDHQTAHPCPSRFAMDSCKIDHRARSGDTLVYRFDPVIRRLPSLGEARALPGYGTVRRGPLLSWLRIGLRRGENPAAATESLHCDGNGCRCGNIDLSPLYHLLQPWRDRQVLFANPRRL
jgi:hypothetical protein